MIFNINDRDKKEWWQIMVLLMLSLRYIVASKIISTRENAYVIKHIAIVDNDLSKGLLKSIAQRRFLKVPASGNERS